MQRRQRHSLPATQAEYTVRQGFRIQTGNVAHFNRPTNGGSKKESTVGKFEGFSNNKYCFRKCEQTVENWRVNEYKVDAGDILSIYTEGRVLSLGSAHGRSGSSSSSSSSSISSSMSAAVGGGGSSGGERPSKSMKVSSVFANNSACPFEGCPKKLQSLDEMMAHLETHRSGGGGGGGDRTGDRTVLGAGGGALLHSSAASLRVTPSTGDTSMTGNVVDLASGSGGEGAPTSKKPRNAPAPKESNSTFNCSICGTCYSVHKQWIECEVGHIAVSGRAGLYNLLKSAFATLRDESGPEKVDRAVVKLVAKLLHNPDGERDITSWRSISCLTGDSSTGAYKSMESVLHTVVAAVIKLPAQSAGTHGSPASLTIESNASSQRLFGSVAGASKDVLHALLLEAAPSSPDAHSKRGRGAAFSGEMLLREDDIGLHSGHSAPRPGVVGRAGYKRQSTHSLEMSPPPSALDPFFNASNIDKGLIGALEMLVKRHPLLLRELVQKYPVVGQAIVQEQLDSIKVELGMWSVQTYNAGGIQANNWDAISGLFNEVVAKITGDPNFKCLPGMPEIRKLDSLKRDLRAHCTVVNFVDIEGLVALYIQPRFMLELHLSYPYVWKLITSERKEARVCAINKDSRCLQLVIRDKFDAAELARSGGKNVKSSTRGLDLVNTGHGSTLFSNEQPVTHWTGSDDLKVLELVMGSTLCFREDVPPAGLEEMSFFTASLSPFNDEKGESTPEAVPVPWDTNSQIREIEHSGLLRGAYVSPDLISLTGRCEGSIVGGGGSHEATAGAVRGVRGGGRGGESEAGAAARACVRGLSNLGNTCYLNSLLQCLACNGDLRRSLLAPGVPTPSSKKSLASEFSKTIASLAPGSKAANATLSPCDLHACLEFPFNLRKQQDPAELLRILLDRDKKRGSSCPSQHRSVAVTAEAESLFTGTLETRVTCRTCQNVSCSPEPFSDLCLSFAPTPSLPNGAGGHGEPQKQTLQGLLRGLLAEEVMEGTEAYACESCAARLNGDFRQTADRLTVLTTTPAHLVVCLKRFHFDLASEARLKIGDHVSFPLVFRLPVEHKGQSGVACEQEISYGLYGIIVHTGQSAQNGHYYSLAQESDRVSVVASEQWRKYDDEKVDAVPRAHIQALSRGRCSSFQGSPYILFYRRLDDDGDGSTRTNPVPKDDNGVSLDRAPSSSSSSSLSLSSSSSSSSPASPRIVVDDNGGDSQSDDEGVDERAAAEAVVDLLESRKPVVQKLVTALFRCLRGYTNQDVSSFSTKEFCEGDLGGALEPRLVTALFNSARNASEGLKTAPGYAPVHFSKFQMNKLLN